MLKQEYALDGILLIQIRDVLKEIDRTHYVKRGTGRLLLPWLTAPIEGVLNARQAGMSYRNDEAVT